MYDLIIIGAGPAGISAAYEAKKAGLDYVVIEKGLIGNTIYNYPVGLTVFSTVNELEIESGGLHPAREKPTREELLSYYVRFVLENDLHVRTEETVRSITCITPNLNEGESSHIVPLQASNIPGHLYEVETDRDRYLSKNVLFATGAMDHPRHLNVPGEDLPHVFDHFRETYPWVKKRALVVGGGNSAGEAALFLAQEGAETTLAIFRDDWENTDPKQGCIKYWVKEPLENEVREQCLSLFFLGKVKEIRVGETELESESGESVTLPCDVVFVLIGSDADLTMLKSLGVATEHGKYGEVPVYDPETFETNVPGIYVAGHFTHQRHIKGAIDAGKAVVPAIAAQVHHAVQ
ncbi:MAG: NAD(P)-binding domain-containing protein [Acidobacteria bacterium]|nr:NAD(P)-binding domain-containing protein [Acidobacteriota bacterium]MCW5948870.1 NAD(P)-binding domain-containing protein [Pyrinomonadaceae bacterium]